MQRTQITKVSTDLDAAQYVNTETGETLASETTDKISITMKTKTGQFIINSDEYVVFSSDALAYLCTILNNAEIARVLKMGNMVKTDCSVLFTDNNAPHTSESLSKTLELSKSEFYKMVKKLVKQNILAYTVCAPTGHVKKVYLLNPFVARKRKTINCEVLNYFSDISSR